MTDRELRPFRLPLRTRFRGLVERRGCLIAGEHGWGEFAPFDDYSPQADARWLASAIEQADGRWPLPVRQEVAVNAIIPAVTPARAAAMAVASGCETVKVKVGDEGGHARVAAIRDALPSVRIRVDVNGAWTLSQAVERLGALSAFGLEYAEQPVRTFEEMGRLRELVDVRLAADELLRIDRRFDDVAEVADVAVLKVAPLGGVAATLDAASRVGLPVVVSSALDSSLGLAAGLAAACALSEPPLACGLGTGALFAADTTEPLLPVGGHLRWTGYPQPHDHLPSAPGDLDYWRERIARAG
jgi:O-succinylbenzoate synthase